MVNNPMKLNTGFVPEKGAWGNKRVTWRGHQWNFFDTYSTATPAHAAIDEEKLKHPRRTYGLIRCQEGKYAGSYVVYWRLDV